MSVLKNIKTVFFDYDGTLHDSMKIYKPALIKAYSYLVAKKMATKRTLKDEEIKYWLGFNSKEMWKNFMPNLPLKMQDEARNMVGEEMKSCVKNNKAKLYEGALETLNYLKNKGYHIVFVSNCSNYYKDIHNEAFKLDEYFEELACAQEYKYVPKYEFLSKVMKKYPKDMVIIGDRYHDMEAGKINNIYTIGCEYGFGGSKEVSNADFVIKDIRELKKYL